MTYTKNILINRLTSYKNFYNSSKLHKKIRKPNFPEDISENLVKITISEQCTWKEKSGDLYSEVLGKIEIKCFSSTGPISFGPCEKWDILYIVDASEFESDNFTIHKINMSSEEFGEIRISKSQLYKDQVNQKRRPRIVWKNLQKQISNHTTSEKICLASI